jgi:hypothetical protein
LSLRSRIVPVSALTNVERQRMWSLFSEYYECVDEPTFQSDLASKDKVILLEDGRIQGFSTMKELCVTASGRTHRGMFSGDTVVAQPYWGSRTLGQTFLMELARRALRHPWTPYWWILITKGYKTYLLMANNFPEHFPNAQRDTPPEVAPVMHAFGETLFGRSYSSDQGLVRYPQSRGQLKTGIAEVDEDLRTRNPKVAFFEENNPGWRQGDELLCVARMRATLPLRYAAKAWRDARGAGEAS